MQDSCHNMRVGWRKCVQEHEHKLVLMYCLARLSDARDYAVHVVDESGEMIIFPTLHIVELSVE